MIYRISRPQILRYKHTVCKNNIVRIIIIWKPLIPGFLIPLFINLVFLDPAEM